MWQAIGEAIGLGIWTATNPCPLATNIAAIAFLGRRLGGPRRVLLAGLLYALGNTLTYVVLTGLLVAGVRASPMSAFLERHVHQVLGPVLIVTAMVLLELIRLPRVRLGLDPGLATRWERWGIWAALPLGVLLALAFCPISAACFFVSVFRLSARYDSCVVLPSCYGIGTALPVVLFALLLAFGTQAVGKTFRATQRVDWWVQRIAGMALLLSGVYLSLRFIFGLFTLAAPPC